MFNIWRNASKKDNLLFCGVTDKTICGVTVTEHQIQCRLRSTRVAY